MASYETRVCPPSLGSSPTCFFSCLGLDEASEEVMASLWKGMFLINYVLMKLFWILLIMHIEILSSITTLLFSHPRFEDYYISEANHLKSSAKTNNHFYYVTKMKFEVGSLPCNRLSHPVRETRIKITLVARPLLTSLAQKLCRCGHRVITSWNCVRS
jgi:hypothetical protein